MIKCFMAAVYILSKHVVVFAFMIAWILLLDPEWLLERPKI
jgi:hypothetical protein